MAILHRPGALDDAEALDEANRLLTEARTLRDQAGPSMTLGSTGHAEAVGSSRFFRVSCTRYTTM